MVFLRALSEKEAQIVLSSLDLGHGHHSAGQCGSESAAIPLAKFQSAKLDSEFSSPRNLGGKKRLRFLAGTLRWSGDSVGVEDSFFDSGRPHPPRRSRCVCFAKVRKAFADGLSLFRSCSMAPDNPANCGRP